MLITGLRLSEALSLNVEHASRAKIELKVKRWTKNKTEGSGLPSNRQSHRPKNRGVWLPIGHKAMVWPPMAKAIAKAKGRRKVGLRQYIFQKLYRDI